MQTKYRAMAHNSQFDFRLKVDILELEFKSKSKLTAITSDVRASSTSSSSSSQFSSVASIAPKITRPVATVTDYAIHTLDTFEIGPNDIEYRAEGNANIVLALPQRCQVLRLPKLQQQQRLFSSSFFFLFLFAFEQFRWPKANYTHTNMNLKVLATKSTDLFLFFSLILCQLFIYLFVFFRCFDFFFIFQIMKFRFFLSCMYTFNLHLTLSHTMELEKWNVEKRGSNPTCLCVYDRE